MINNILIVKTGALGDVLRTTVILEGLETKYVNPKIYWLTSKKAGALLNNNPFIEEVFYIEDLPTNFEQFYFDLIISLEEDEGLLKKVAQLKKKDVFGIYLEDGKIKYTHNSSTWYDMSLISRFNKEVADKLKQSNIFSYPEILYKMLNLDWQYQRYKLFPVKKDFFYANKFKKNLNPEKIVVGIFTGAGERWPMKSLPIDKQEELVNQLINKYGDWIQIILLSGPSELELKISKEIKTKFPTILNHEIQDLEQFIGIVNLCDIVISPDSLAMHIAVALDKHIIAYFTVTPASEIEIYTGYKVLAEHEDYATYNRKMKPRPNITDSIDLNEIIFGVKKVLDKKHHGDKGTLKI